MPQIILFSFQIVTLVTSWYLLWCLTNQASTDALLINQRRNDITAITHLWNKYCHYEHFYVAILFFFLWKWFHFSSGAVRAGTVAAVVAVADIVRLHDDCPITESNQDILIIWPDEFMQTWEIQKLWLTWVSQTAHHRLFLSNHHPQGFAAALWWIQFLYHLYPYFQCKMRTLMNVNILFSKLERLSNSRKMNYLKEKWTQGASTGHGMAEC